MLNPWSSFFRAQEPPVAAPTGPQSSKKRVMSRRKRKKKHGELRSSSKNDECLRKMVNFYEKYRNNYVNFYTKNDGNMCKFVGKKVIMFIYPLDLWGHTWGSGCIMYNNNKKKQRTGDSYTKQTSGIVSFN